MSQGICRFAGIKATKGWEFNFSPGVEPSTCVITTVGNLENVPRFGTLTLEHDGRELVFPECIVTKPYLTAGAGGTFLKIPVLDRRWKWAFSQIDGSYNVKVGQEVVRPKRPQELATLLFEAFGEKKFSVEKLPNDKDFVLPADWQGVPAAPLLSQLCTQLGCIPNLNAMTNRAQIDLIGDGLELPDHPTTRRATNASVRPIPDEVRVVTAPAQFQVPFSLEAVGVDTDGTVKPINKLSYKPENGWENTDPVNMYSVTGTYKKDDQKLQKRDLATSSVWKMYRVKGIVGKKLKSLTGTDFEPKGTQELLPLRQTRLSTFVDQDGETKEEPYSVVGSYALPHEQAVFNGVDNAQDKAVPQAWSRLDGERGLVFFNQPMFFWGAGNRVQAAVLRLVTSFSVKKDGVIVRHEEFRPVNEQPQGTGPFLIRRPKLRRKVIEENGQVKQDNVKEVEAEANKYLQRFFDANRLFEGETAVYEGIRRWTVDGLTRQITWSGGGGRPAATTISQQEEHNPYVKSYEEQREKVEEKQVFDEAEFLLGFNREIFNLGT